MLILYDALPSANSERVKIVLHEKGLAHRRITLDLQKNEQKSAEFLRLNPYGKVPVLRDGDCVLFESCIINEYLDEKYPDPPLMPADPCLRGRGRVLIDYTVNFLHDVYWSLREDMRKPADQRESVNVEQKRSILKSRLRYLEDALGEREYFLDFYSLVDIAVWPRLCRLAEFGVLGENTLTGLQSWLDRMNARPSVKAATEYHPFARFGEHAKTAIGE